MVYVAGKGDWCDPVYCRRKRRHPVVAGASVLRRKIVAAAIAVATAFGVACSSGQDQLLTKEGRCETTLARLLARQVAIRVESTLGSTLKWEHTAILQVELHNKDDPAWVRDEVLRQYKSICPGVDKIAVELVPVPMRDP